MAEYFGWEEKYLTFVLNTGYNAENYVCDGVIEGYPCLGNEKMTKTPSRKRSI